MLKYLCCMAVSLALTKALPVVEVTVDEAGAVSNARILRTADPALDGAVLTLAHAYDGNLFHWLFELLPKLALLDAAGVERLGQAMAKNAYGQYLLALLREPAVR